MNELKIHSDTAWNIASQFADLLASDTRTLAAMIDAALAEATPPPVPHVGPDAAARLERILRLGRSMKWTPHGAPALDDENTAVALGELFQIFFQDAVDRALATTEGSTK